MDNHSETEEIIEDIEKNIEPAVEESEQNKAAVANIETAEEAAKVETKPKKPTYQPEYLTKEEIHAALHPEKPSSYFMVSLLLFLCASVIIALLTMFFVPTDMAPVLANCKAYPLITLLNTLPIFFIMSILYCIFGKRIFSGVLTILIFAIAVAIHLVKMALRNEPFLPTDTALIEEALVVVATYPTSQLILIGVGILLFIVLLVVLYRCSKEKTLPIKVRFCGLIALLAVVAVNSSLYKNPDVFASFPVDGSPNSINNQYEARGLVYTFFHQFYVEKEVTPTTYDVFTYASLEAEPQISADQELPHIIMIMGEAFSDLTNNPHLDFSETRDPLQEFKAMQESENGFGGKIVVPGYGGGTANTEHDVLTGFPTSLLSRPLASYDYIQNPTDALPRRLQSIGYETVAMHPGYAWFYNRNLAYPRLGFETAYFLEDSFNLEDQGIGGYINETATMDHILNTFETHLATSDAPLFSFTVTIQNHGPYESRFGPIPDSFTSDVELTDFEYDLLNQYAKGITDADLQLARLRDYAAESTEPIVIVYYGDHLPCFTNGKEFFDILEYPINEKGNYEEQLAMYEVPFVIWGNDAAMELSDIKANAENSNFPESGIISAHYMTPLLTHVLNMTGLSPLFDYGYELLGELPIATKNIYMEGSGTYSYNPSEASQENLDYYLAWVHYKLTDGVVDTEDFLDIIPANSYVPEPVVMETSVPAEVVEDVPIDEDIATDDVVEESLSEEVSTDETTENEETLDQTTLTDEEAPLDTDLTIDEEEIPLEAILPVTENTTDTAEEILDTTDVVATIPDEINFIENDIPEEEISTKNEE